MFSHVKVAKNFKEALMIMTRVIYALILRETKTMYGQTKFGYLWAIVQTAFGICVIWGVRSVMGSMSPYGLPMPMFLLCGFAAWGVFSSSLSKVMVVISSNLSLLYYSKVRHFDLIVARVILITATNTVVFIVLAFVFYLLDYKFTIASLWPFIISWFYLALLGMGLGAFFCAVFRYSASARQFVPMITRLGIFLSGVMWSYTRLPNWMVKYAMLNPVFQLIEYSRMSFSYVYPGNVLDVQYVSMVTLVVLVLGFGAEMATRRKRDVV